MSFSVFLARRFYRVAGQDRKRRASSLAIRIATAGVAVGLAVMIVSICVVRGFQAEIRAKLTGFAAHIEVLDVSSFASPESFPVVAGRPLVEKLQAVDGVERVEPVSLKMGIMKTEEAFHTIILKGVGKDYDLSFLKSQLVEGKMPIFGNGKSRNEVIISRKQAEALGLSVGSKVYTYFISEDIRLRRFTVSGIYETNLSQFDDHFVWSDIETVRKLNAWQEDQCSALEVYVDGYDRIDDVQRSIAPLVNGRYDRYGAAYASLSVKENPRTAAVVQWLSLLDFNVWVILALMVGVAGFTMISGLLILIMERTQTIGVLKALGTTNMRVRHTFIIYAFLIILRGLFWGNLLGVGLVLAQQYWGLVRLDPATYYVEAAPVEFDWPYVLALNLGTMLVCTLALVVPSYIISRISPAKAIRFE